MENKDKLDKLKDIFTLINDGSVKYSDLKAFLEMIVQTIQTQKINFANISAENLKLIEDSAIYFNQKNEKWEKEFEGKYSDKTKELEKLINIVKKYKPIPGKDGIDGINSSPEDIIPLILKKLPEHKETVLDDRKEIIKKLNEGKSKDKKIKLEQIEGGKEIELNAANRALSVLDQRTKFLINKNVKHDSTLTGKGTDDDPLSVAPGVDTDEKVKYNAGDPTAGYVADKIIAGTGISVAEGTGASENKLVITNDNPTIFDPALYEITYDGDLVLK